MLIVARLTGRPLRPHWQPTAPIDHHRCPVVAGRLLLSGNRLIGHLARDPSLGGRGRSGWSHRGHRFLPHSPGACIRPLIGLRLALRLRGGYLSTVYVGRQQRHQQPHHDETPDRSQAGSLLPQRVPERHYTPDLFGGLPRRVRDPGLVQLRAGELKHALQLLGHLSVAPPRLGILGRAYTSSAGWASK